MISSPFVSGALSGSTGLESKGPVQLRGTRVAEEVEVNGASLAASGRPSALYIVQTEKEGA